MQRTITLFVLTFRSEFDLTNSMNTVLILRMISVSTLHIKIDHFMINVLFTIMSVDKHFY